jgi:DNA polymerase-3 subunit delta'
MMTREPHPWHAALWRRLCAQINAERLPHAVLLSGRSSIGKRFFADCLAARLLCEQRAVSAACGACRACKLFAAGNHPDYLRVEPTGEGGQITIDSIRDLTAFMSLTSHYGRPKVVALAPAETMNRAAANALLKTLEEPPGAALLILISENPSLLPPTIRSRCQRYALDRFDRDAARLWLEGRGVPILAQRLRAPLHDPEGAESDGVALEDLLPVEVAAMAGAGAPPVEVATRLAKFPAVEIVEASARLLETLVYTRAGLVPDVSGAEPSGGLQALANRLDWPAAFKLYDVLADYRRMLLPPNNPRTQDVIDGVTAAWAAAYETESDSR